MKTYTSLSAWEDDARQIGYVQHEDDSYSWVANEHTGECVGEYIQDRGYLYTGDDDEIFYK